MVEPFGRGQPRMWDAWPRRKITLTARAEAASQRERDRDENGPAVCIEQTTSPDPIAQMEVQRGCTQDNPYGPIREN